MIYHLKDAGVIRTQSTDAAMFECQVCGTTWSDKRDVWQDCAPYVDVPNHVKVAVDPAPVKVLPPVRDPKEPRAGTVVEKVPPPDPEPAPKP